MYAHAVMLVAPILQRWCDERQGTCGGNIPDSGLLSVILGMPLCGINTRYLTSFGGHNPIKWWRSVQREEPQSTQCSAHCGALTCFVSHAELFVNTIRVHTS